MSYLTKGKETHASYLTSFVFVLRVDTYKGTTMSFYAFWQLFANIMHMFIPMGFAWELVKLAMTSCQPTKRTFARSSAHPSGMRRCGVKAGKFWVSWGERGNDYGGVFHRTIIFSPWKNFIRISYWILSISPVWMNYRFLLDFALENP